MIKKKQTKKPRKEVDLVPEKVQVAKKQITFYLPPGTKFSDIYMDVQQVAQELCTSKRTVANMRTSGKLSYTTLNNRNGKIYYFRQEIAARLDANKKIIPGSLHFL